MATNGRIEHSEVNSAGDIVRRIERRFTTLPDNSVNTADLTTILNYDAMGRLTSAIDPGPEANQANRTTTHAYSQLGLQTITTDRFGITGTVIRDAAGQVVSEINPDGSVVSNLYDAAGSRLEQKHEFPFDENGNADPNGFRRVLFTWDALGRLSTTALAATRTSTSPDDLIVRNTYVVQNSPFGTTGQSQTIQVRRADLNQNTPVTTTYSDAAGKQVRQVLPAVPVAGSTVSVSPVLRTEYAFDRDSHTVDVYQYDPLDRRTQTSLNESGQQLRQRAPVGKVNNAYTTGIVQTETSYDPALRAIRIDNLSDNGVMLKQYDPATGMVSRIQRTSTSQGTNPATGLITTYIFDSAGNVLRQTDPAINVVHWAYDSLGRKTSETTKIDVMTGPGETNGFKDVTRTWSYQGMVTTYKDRNGRITVTSPDPTSNTIVEEWKNSTTGPVIHSIETIYDSAGGLLSAAEYDGTVASGTIKSLVAFDIDQFGRATEETQLANIFGLAAPVTHLVSQFNSLGLRNQLEVRRDHDLNTPGDQLFSTTTSGFDSLGRLLTLSRDVNQNEGALWKESVPPSDSSVSFAYHLDGKRAEIERFGQSNPTSGVDPEGFSQYEFDTAGRLDTIEHFRSGQGILIALNKSTFTARGRLAESQRLLFDSGPVAPGQGQTPIVNERFKYSYTPGGQIDLVEEHNGTDWVTKRDYVYGAHANRDNGTVGKHNRLISATEGDWARFRYDDEGNLTTFDRDILPGVVWTNNLTWDHRGRLIQVDWLPTAGTAGTRVVFEYDALDRLIGHQTFQFDSGTSPVSIRSYSYDGSTRILESELLSDGRITRSYVTGVGGEILAIEQTVAASLPVRFWMMTDAAGSATSIASVDPQGEWQIQHRRTDEFGAIDFDNASNVVGDRSAIMDGIPVVWNGALRFGLGGALGTVYLMNGRWFDDQFGRFLSEDPAGYGGGQTNLYVLNGNDPFAVVSETGIDWSKLEGPSPFNGLGAFGYGAWDAITFGHFDHVFDTSGAREQAAQNGWYYAGMAFGVASQIAVGNIAAGHLSAMSAATAAGTAARIGAAARTATVAARAYQAYSIAGDVVGIHDSLDAYFSGEFSALDLLGFAPTIGWASRGMGGLKALADVPGVRQAGTALLNDFLYAPRRGMLNLGAIFGDTPGSSAFSDVPIPIASKIPGNSADEIIDSLPQFVRGAGIADNAHGVLVVNGRAYKLASGGPNVASGYAQRLAPRNAAELGIGFTERNMDHVEGAASSLLRRLIADGEEIANVQLYINRGALCPGKAGCYANIRRMLPEGVTAKIFGTIESGRRRRAIDLGEFTGTKD